MFSHVYTLLVGAFFPFVSASIYPTEPVQATVWSADQPMSVSWIEDWKYPVLSAMGPLDISLWRDTNTYLVRLASNVDPLTKSYRVTVPREVLNQGSKYTLRFTTTKPIESVIYSADFVIVPMVNVTTSTAMGGNGTLATQTQTMGGTTVGSSDGLFVTTTTTLGFDCTSTAGPLTPLGTPPPAREQGQGQQRAASAGRRSASLDIEKLKFRFVFVIWPVLMGITMAL